MSSIDEKLYYILEPVVGVSRSDGDFDYGNSLGHYKHSALQAIKELFIDFAEENSTHYQRTCVYCGNTWLGLHCVHDGYQNACPNCERKPNPIDYHECKCLTVLELGEVGDTPTHTKESHTKSIGEN
jgi:hypothetical protein